MRRRGPFFIVLFLWWPLALLEGCGGGGSPPPPLQPSARVVVGDYNLAFKSVYAGYLSADNTLGIFMIQDPQTSQSPYPFATVSVEGASALQVGTPADCGVAVVIAEDISFASGTEWPGEPDPISSVTFSRLELTAGGRVSGSVTGTAMRPEDPQPSPVGLSCSFKDVPVIVQ